MKFLSLLLALLCFGCGCGGADTPAPPSPTAAAPAPPTTGETIERIRDTTVAIVNDGDIYCSGVWVGTFEILTAAHCVAPEGPTLIALYEQYDIGKGFGQLVKGHVTVAVKVDKLQDLALLVTVEAFPAHGVAVMAGSGPFLAQHVHIVGHTIGIPYAYTPGFVDGVRHMHVPDLEMSGDYIQVWAGAYGGNSGGGLWSEAGELLGICNFRAGSLHFFSAPSAIAKFLA